MIVCAECHEKDKNVIKCNIEEHASWGVLANSRCGICGKQDKVVMFCYNYRHYIMELPPISTEGS